MSLTTDALSLRKTEGRYLRKVLVLRNLDNDALAAKSGVHKRVIQNIICGSNTSWPPRRAINQALQMKVFSRPPGKPKSNRLKP